MSSRNTWEVYGSGEPGAWRWRKRSRNGNIVAASTEAYSRRRSAVANAIKEGGPVALRKPNCGVVYV